MISRIKILNIPFGGRGLKFLMVAKVLNFYTIKYNSKLFRKYCLISQNAFIMKTDQMKYLGNKHYTVDRHSRTQQVVCIPFVFLSLIL